MLSILDTQKPALHVLKTNVYLCGMFSKRLFKAVLFTCTLLLMAGISPAIAQSGSKPEDSTGSFRFKTIVIDPGHGGKDPGAHGGYSNEKAVALSIGKKLRDALNDQLPGINVIMTRGEDKFIELHRRAEIANNAHANLFISIHCNSSPERVGSRRGGAVAALWFSP